MRIDILDPQRWNDLNETYRAALGIEESSVFVQVYAGYQHALWETTNALARLFSHKKNIAFTPSIEPSLDALAAEFSEKEYVIENFTAEDLKDGKAIAGSISELLFIVAPQDDSITGRVFDHSGLDAVLKEKRVFKITLSHAAFRSGKIERPGLFEVKILSLAPDLAVVVAGERTRLKPLLPSRMDWLKAATPTKDIMVPSDWKTRIEAFEAKLPAGFKAYFSAGEARVYDRAVIYHPELDGSAVIDELNRLLQYPAVPPGIESAFESTSSCRWTSPRLTEFLLQKEGSEDKVRGLVLIGADQLNANLELLLKQTAETLLRQQNG